MLWKGHRSVQVSEHQWCVRIKGHLVKKKTVACTQVRILFRPDRSYTILFCVPGARRVCPLYIRGTRQSLACKLALRYDDDLSYCLIDVNLVGVPQNSLCSPFAYGS
jgi:hypothetical protein